MGTLTNKHFHPLNLPGLGMFINLHMRNVIKYIPENAKVECALGKLLRPTIVTLYIFVPDDYCRFNTIHVTFIFSSTVIYVSTISVWEAPHKKIRSRSTN